MADDGPIGQRIGLRGILVARRLVSERLHELIGEDLDIGAFAALEGRCSLLRLADGPHGDLGLLVVAVVVLFGDDDGGVGVAAEDALVPHEVVVDELAE